MSGVEGRLRVGAVSYLNTRPLVHGMERGLGADRIRLSYARPAELADAMAAGEYDIALIPVIELARMPDLELVPGLGIVTRGRSRSVLLVGNRPVEEIRTVSLDPSSRSSNALVQVLFDRVWKRRPEFVRGGSDLAAALDECDAVIRIGDKALCEPVPEGAHVEDLAEVWTERTGLPFVYAAWAARPGVVDQEIYRILHQSRREGARAIDEIAAGYEWQGAGYPDLAREYLTQHIAFRLGTPELDAMRLFFRNAAELGVIDAAPEIKLAFRRWTTCHDEAVRRGLVPPAG